MQRGFLWIQTAENIDIISPQLKFERHLSLNKFVQKTRIIEDNARSFHQVSPILLLVNICSPHICVCVYWWESQIWVVPPGCLENLARNQFPVCGHFLSDDKNKSIVFVFDITVYGPGKDSSFLQLIFQILISEVLSNWRLGDLFYEGEAWFCANGGPHIKCVNTVIF